MGAFKLKQALEGHTKAISSLRFSPKDGKLLASASADKTVKLWELGDDGMWSCKHTLTGHTLGISDVAWNAEGTYLVTASDDKTLRIWDAATGECCKTLKGHTNYVFCCNFNPLGNLIVSGSFDETVRLWDVRTGKTLKELPAHSDPVTAVGFGRNGEQIVSCSYDGLIRIWNTETGNCMKTIVDRDNPPVSFAQFSPNSKFILGSTLDNKIRLWKCEDATTVKTYKGHKNEKYCVFACFSIVGPKYVFTGSEDHGVYVYNLNGGLAHTIPGRETPESPGDGHCDVVLCVAAHPLQPLLASGWVEAQGFGFRVEGRSRSRSFHWTSRLFLQ